MTEIQIDTTDGPMGLFVAEPETAPRGGVVVIQEAFGITPHIQSVCHFLAAAGWLAAAPVLFHRVGSPVFSYDDIAGAMPAMQSLTKEGIDTDLDASIEYLADRGFTAANTGIVGFCMGGSVTLYAAATRTLGAAVTFYGGGLAQGRFGFPPGLELGAEIRSPWLGLYGDQDQGIPVADVERLREIASTRPVPTEVVRYPDGFHGFNCDDRPSVFNAEIATDARARLLTWLDEQLG